MQLLARTVITFSAIGVLLYGLFTAGNEVEGILGTRRGEVVVLDRSDIPTTLYAIWRAFLSMIPSIFFSSVLVFLCNYVK